MSYRETVSGVVEHGQLFFILYIYYIPLDLMAAIKNALIPINKAPYFFFLFATLFSDAWSVYYIRTNNVIHSVAYIVGTFLDLFLVLYAIIWVFVGIVAFGFYYLLFAWKNWQKRKGIKWTICVVFILANSFLLIVFFAVSIDRLLYSGLVITTVTYLSILAKYVRLR